LQLRAITPEELQIVEATRLCAHEVEHDIAEIHQDPESSLVPFDPEGAANALSSEFLEHEVSGVLQLTGRGAGGKNKIAGDLEIGPDVEDHDVTKSPFVKKAGAQTCKILALRRGQRARNRNLFRFSHLPVTTPFLYSGDKQRCTFRSRISIAEGLSRLA
jgi:hypothetical protein